MPNPKRTPALEPSSTPPRGSSKAPRIPSQPMDRQPLQRVETGRQDNRLIVIASNIRRGRAVHKPRVKQHLRARSFGDMRGLWIDTRRLTEHVHGSLSAEKQRARSSPATPSMSPTTMRLDSAIQMPSKQASYTGPWPPWASRDATPTTNTAFTARHVPDTPAPVDATRPPSLPGFSALCQSLESGPLPTPLTLNFAPLRKDWSVAHIPAVSLAGYRTSGISRAGSSKSLDTGRDFLGLVNASPLANSTVHARPRASTLDRYAGIAPTRGRPPAPTASAMMRPPLTNPGRELVSGLPWGLIPKGHADSPHSCQTALQPPQDPMAPARPSVPFAKRPMCLSKELRSRAKPATRPQSRISHLHQHPAQSASRPRPGIPVSLSPARQFGTQGMRPVLGQSRAHEARPVILATRSIRLSKQSRSSTTPEGRRKTPKHRPAGPAVPTLPDFIFDLEMLAFSSKARMHARPLETEQPQRQGRGIAISRMHHGPPSPLELTVSVKPASMFGRAKLRFPDVPVRESRLRQAAEQWMDDASSSTSTSSSPLSDSGFDELATSDMKRGDRSDKAPACSPIPLRPAEAERTLKRKVSSDGGSVPLVKRNRYAQLSAQGLSPDRERRPASTCSV